MIGVDRIHAVVAKVSQPVPIRVRLGLVGQSRTIVHLIQDTVVVAVVAGVPPTVAVPVRLIWIINPGAIVAGIAETVPVGIRLVRVDHRRAIIAGVAHPIAGISAAGVRKAAVPGTPPIAFPVVPAQGPRGAGLGQA